MVSATLAPSFLWAEELNMETVDPACNERSWQYCQLPNRSENCAVSTCQDSLSSSGNCRVEAIYDEDETSIASCRVCATEAINCDACRSLGGTCTTSS